MALKASKKANQTSEASAEKVDQIDSILGQKEFKQMHLGSRSGDEIVRPDIISTGSFYFDQVLGGGFRSSSWMRFYGPEESGKTSQGLFWGRQWQDFYGERGMVVVFNAEGRVSKDLIHRSGINTAKDRFRIIDSNKSDFIYTMIDRLVNDNPDEIAYYFVVDSTDACERTVDMEKNLGDAEKIGGSATILSAAGKRLSLIFSVTGHSLYMTSQTRDKLVKGPGAGGGKTASGGNAPRFYSSLTGQIKKHWSDLKILDNPSDDKSKEVGRMWQCLLEKTPNETSGTTVVVPVRYGKIGGVWREYEAMMMAQTWGKIEDKGSGNFELHSSFLEECKAAGVTIEKAKVKGARALREIFEANPELVNYVHAEMRKLFIPAG